MNIFMICTKKFQYIHSDRRRLLFTRLLPIVTLLLLVGVSALPALAQERLPAPAPQTFVHGVNDKAGGRQCDPETGECISYDASKCIDVSFTAIDGVNLRDYAIRLWYGKNQAGVVAGYDRYPKKWFNPWDWHKTQSPEIGGGITPIGDWPDSGNYVEFTLCGLASGQTVKLKFRAEDARENSQYKYGEKTKGIKVKL